MGFFEALKASVKGFTDGPEPGQYVVAGRPVRCAHCGEKHFVDSAALLNTRMRSAFNIDWTDPQAFLLICAECGRIEWFASEPQATAEARRE
jgi:hypothetical protein